MPERFDTCNTGLGSRRVLQQRDALLDTSCVRSTPLHVTSNNAEFNSAAQRKFAERASPMNLLHMQSKKRALNPCSCTLLCGLRSSGSHLKFVFLVVSILWAPSRFRLFHYIWQSVCPTIIGQLSALRRKKSWKAHTKWRCSANEFDLVHERA